MKIEQQKQTIKTILQDAYERIIPPEKFTTNFRARTSNGTPTSPLFPEAVSWCALGSLERSSVILSTYLGSETHSLWGYDIGRSLLMKKKDDLFPQYDTVAELNDDSGHETVSYLYQETINDLDSSNLEDIIKQYESEEEES